MKIITIGRGENSHIFIDNPLVSRQHALLKIKSNGKMTIVDKSSNGTSINGSKIKPERDTPVTRRDVVTFAGVSQLDWKEVPDPLKVYKIIGLVLAGFAVVLGIIFGIKALIPEPEPAEENTSTLVVYPESETKEKPAPANPAEKDIDPDAELSKWKRENRQQTGDKTPKPQPKPDPEEKPLPEQMEKPDNQDTKPAETEKPKQESTQQGGPILF